MRARRRLKPGETREVTVPALQCRCARCEHEWLAVSRDGSKPERPSRCAGCKAELWWLPARPGPGRPPRPKKPGA